jgi:hypothetical protein
MMSRRDIRFLVRHVPERADFLPDLRRELPTLEVIQDRERNAMATWLDAMEHAGQDAVVHLEDDVIPTQGLEAKLRAVIDHKGEFCVQFFSIRPFDFQKGSRWMTGGGFSMTQCFYLPPGWSSELLGYYPSWPRRHVGVTALDWMVADWLKSWHERYWLHVPSLVQHRPITSAINPNRSTRRQSPTFKTA